MEQRQAKALHIAATTALAPDNGRWKVPSQTGHGTYAVLIAADGSWHCGCPDFEERLSPCKHILAVEITIQREAGSDGRVAYSETVKVTYSQDWTAYNRAQCDEKLRRAEEHLETLKGMLGLYLDDHLDRFRVEIDEHGALTRTGSFDETPIEWGPVIGDVVHNLRSALEHLAGALIVGNGGKPTNDTKFPIRKDKLPADHYGKHPLPNIGPKPGAQMAARQILDGYQPYQLGHLFAMHPLFELEEMWNQDKHRLLVAAGWWFGYEVMANETYRKFHGTSGRLEVAERAEDRTRFLLVPDTEPDVDVDFEAILFIRFAPSNDAAREQPVFEYLSFLRMIVDNVVTELRPYTVAAEAHN